VIALVAAESTVCAQTPAPSAGTGDPSAPANPAAQPVNLPYYSPSPNRAESSLFYFLMMSGRTQADFQPLTAADKAKVYAKGLFSPFHFLTAAASAGITQWEDVPASWGQGAEGFGRRFGNYFVKQTVQRTLRLGGEELLQEDNRYFGSGEHGVGRRIVYAVKMSILARTDDGSTRISLSEIGSTAGAAFISRLWQPSTNSSAGDGAMSFGISMATNAGVNVLREFLPNVTRHVFWRHQESQAFDAPEHHDQVASH